MSDEGARGPFVPLPLAGTPRAADGPRPSIVVVYLRYRDPDPLEFAGTRGRLAGPIFHAAGVLLREDDQFVALGEIAHAGENAEYVRQFGRDLFPAYRNVLTVPKASIVERRDVVVAPPRDDGADSDDPAP